MVEDSHLDARGMSASFFDRSSSVAFVRKQSVPLERTCSKSLSSKIDTKPRRQDTSHSANARASLDLRSSEYGAINLAFLLSWLAMYPGDYWLCWFAVVYLAIRDSNRPVFRRARQVIRQALYWLYCLPGHDVASSSSIGHRMRANDDEFAGHRRIQGSVPTGPKATGAISRALHWLLEAFRS